MLPVQREHCQYKTLKQWRSGMSELLSHAWSGGVTTRGQNKKVWQTEIPQRGHNALHVPQWVLRESSGRCLVGRVLTKVERWDCWAEWCWIPLTAACEGARTRRRWWGGEGRRSTPGRSSNQSGLSSDLWHHLRYPSSGRWRWGKRQRPWDLQEHSKTMLNCYIFNSECSGPVTPIHYSCKRFKTKPF